MLARIESRHIRGIAQGVVRVWGNLPAASRHRPGDCGCSIHPTVSQRSHPLMKADPKQLLAAFQRGTWAARGRFQGSSRCERDCRGPSRKTPRGASGIRKGFVKASAFFTFRAFEDLAAVEALDVFRVVILGDQPDAFVLAGRVRHRSFPRLLVRLWHNRLTRMRCSRHGARQLRHFQRSDNFGGSESGPF